jgi:hypothetical protein
LGFTERPHKQRVYLLLRNVEPLEMLVLGVSAPQMRHPRADQEVDALEFGEKMIRRMSIRLHE